jgi:hypothetical protein
MSARQPPRRPDESNKKSWTIPLDHGAASGVHAPGARCRTASPEAVRLSRPDRRYQGPAWRQAGREFAEAIVGFWRSTARTIWPPVGGRKTNGEQAGSRLGIVLAVEGESQGPSGQLRKAQVRRAGGHRLGRRALRRQRDGATSSAGRHKAIARGQHGRSRRRHRSRSRTLMSVTQVIRVQAKAGRRTHAAHGQLPLPSRATR